MKAAQINAYGHSEVLKFTETAPKPMAGEGQVLVEVYAAGVNPFDSAVREGYMQAYSPLKFPATLGGDFAGVVAEVGSGVHDLAVGEEVFGFTDPVGGQGSF